MTTMLKCFTPPHALSIPKSCQCTLYTKVMSMLPVPIGGHCSLLFEETTQICTIQSTHLRVGTVSCMLQDITAQEDRQQERKELQPSLNVGPTLSHGTVRYPLSHIPPCTVTGILFIATAYDPCFLCNGW